MSETPEKVLEIIQRKPLALQVCTNYPEDEIEHITNMKDWCGTEAGWHLSQREDELPVQCEKYPDRKHYILEARRRVTMTTEEGKKLYNEQIAPLMAQIDAICSQHGISYIAAFQYSKEGGTTASCLLKNPDIRLAMAWELLNMTATWEDEAKHDDE